MKKNYLKGIMKVDTAQDEPTKYNRESLEEISLMPRFEGDGDTGDKISSAENDGVENDNMEN